MIGILITVTIVYSILHHYYCIKLRGVLANKIRVLSRRQAFLLLNWLFRVLIPLILAMELGLSPFELGYSLPSDYMKTLILTLLLIALNISVSFTFVWIAVNVLREEKALRKVEKWPSRLGLKDIIEGFLWDFPEEAFYRGFIFMCLKTLGIIPAALFSSFLFALVHTYAGRTWTLMTFINGLIYSYAIYQTDSILVPLILHRVLNISPPLYLRIFSKCNS